LTAPKLDNDEEYCFQFKGTSKNGDQYSTDAKVSVVSPSLEVYVDHASLPSLHQVLDIIASAEAHPTAERYVSWGRINPTQEHLAQLNISRFPLESNHTSAEMLEAISAFAEDHHRLKVSISTNTLKSYDNLKLMLQRLHKQPHVDIDNIRLYDDGSAEYVNLYNWRNTQDKTYLLQQAGDNLKNIILGSGGSSAPWLTTQFNWHSLYPTEYSMLRSDFLTLDPKLHELKEYLGDSLKQMQWDKYAKLSSEQQALFLEIVGFDQNWLQVEYDKSPLANFVFTGTTTWAGGEEKEFYAKQQVNIINNAINETSPYYIGKEHDLFFKGHPRGGVINDII
ncbi:hypothetical protein P3577_24485, partial [Vibrio parahaemolyticus]|nr:hypothetical protein [Vibrio parahaemolyticus]